MKISTFKEYIIEKIDPDSEVGENIAKLIPAIKQWIMTNNVKYSKKLLAMKDIIPKKYRKGGTMFRGMTFKTEKELQSVLNKDTIIKPKGLASWTNKESQGAVYAKFVAGSDNKPSKFGIVFRGQVPDNKVLINLFAFCKDKELRTFAQSFGNFPLRMACAEGESLVMEGVPIDPNNISAVYVNQKKLSNKQIERLLEK